MDRAAAQSHAKTAIRRSIARVASTVVAQAPPPAPDVVGQRNLLFHYRTMLASGAELPTFADAGFGVYSGGDEDGIILLLLAATGTTNRTCAEIGAGAPRGANTTNLIVNWGWRGLLIEANEAQSAMTTEFYARQPRVDQRFVTVCRSWVTVDNVNDLFTHNGFDGKLDLLSLDIDGVDYWIWDALTIVRPGIVVVEVQDIWGAEEAVTVPYRDLFDEGPASGFNYCGASLAAWVKLNRRKGYRLVGATPEGLNAFFVREDLAADALPEVSAASCLDQPWLHAGRARRVEKARQRPWTAV